MYSSIPAQLNMKNIILKEIYSSQFNIEINQKIYNTVLPALRRRNGAPLRLKKPPHNATNNDIRAIQTLKIYK